MTLYNKMTLRFLYDETPTVHSFKWWQKQRLIKFVSPSQIQWPPYWNSEAFYSCACLKTVICHVKENCENLKDLQMAEKYHKLEVVVPRALSKNQQSKVQDCESGPSNRPDSHVMRSCQRSLTWSEVTSSFMWLPIHLCSKNFLWSSVHIWTEG